MALLSDRRNFLIAGGGVAALVAGLALAALFVGSGPEQQAAPPASQAGLVVETAGTDDRVSPTRALRCFVGGQFVGELTLAACAKRNGVATDALDVGVDETGALAAANQAGAAIVPLPPMNEATSARMDGPPPARPAQPPPGAAVPSASAAPSATCWRYAGAEWRKLQDMSLNACVQTLYAGRCERPGAASYGRWGEQTLRLVPGRVEISADNRSFRRLAEQGAGCAIAPIG